MVLERLGIDPGLIDYIMNSFEGSKMAMKTNVPGNITPHITMRKAIKQGCPLAPLLFAIVMDELHTWNRKYQGYTLGNTRVQSRGYCDDTAIISQDIDDLKQMDRWTQYSMAKHGLSINFTRTKLTGRDKERNASADQIYWAGRTKPLDHLDPAKHIKYLGILISFDLE